MKPKFEHSDLDIDKAKIKLQRLIENELYKDCRKSVGVNIDNIYQALEDTFRNVKKAFTTSSFASELQIENLCTEVKILNFQIGDLEREIERLNKVIRNMK